MKLRLINPNSTDAMTQQIARSARAVAHPGSSISALTLSGTPVSIEGYHDEAVCVPPLLEAIRAGEAEGMDAHVIACFDDVGLAAAREVAGGPVLGLCQASVQVAMMISKRFSVVTSLDRSVPIIEDLVEDYGAGRACRRVRAVDLPVLAFEADAALSRARLKEEVTRARDQDKVDAVVLGCAGMSDFCRALEESLQIRVIDGVQAAVKLAEALVGGGFRTAKTGAYAYPRLKSADLAPARVSESG